MGKAWKIDGNFKVCAKNILSSLYFSISIFQVVFEILIWVQQSIFYLFLAIGLRDERGCIPVKKKKNLD